MDLFPIDEQGTLFIAPAIDDWQPIVAQQIDVIFDLNEGLDRGVPALTNQVIYVYFPFDDKALPDLNKLHHLARLGAQCLAHGTRVLCHCDMGHNRSALLAGLILVYRGMPGAQAVDLLRHKRQGALYNKTFAAYLQALPSLAGGMTAARAGVETSLVD